MFPVIGVCRLVPPRVRRLRYIAAAVVFILILLPYQRLVSRQVSLSVICIRLRKLLTVQLQPVVIRRIPRIMEVRAHTYLRVRRRRYRRTASVLPLIRIRAEVHHRRRSHVAPARVQKLHRDPLDPIGPVVVALRVPRYRVRFQPSPERVRITLLPSCRYRLVDPFLLLRVPRDLVYPIRQHARMASTRVRYYPVA